MARTSGDWINLHTVDVNVQDRKIDTFGPSRHKCLGHTIKRADDNAPRVSKHVFNEQGHQHFVLDDKDAQAGKICAGHLS